ncbi:MAG: ABC transporter substrate-binding protein [Spirochaetaceae bacterium]|nr:ABC transporter substrate-binding protein [Spirochaetaceae bacterium]
MKKIICFVIIFALAIPFIFAFGDKEQKPSDKITIYTSMYQDVIEVVKKDLQNQFPKCTIEFVYGGTGRLQHRIAAEQASGKLGCDILMVAEPAYSLELKEKGMLHNYISKEAANLAFDYDPQGYWYPVRINNMVLAYNPAKNSKNTIPNSFFDFAFDPKVKGTISMRNPNISGTSLATLSALRDKYGYEYLDALGKQSIQIEYGTAGSLKKLETGEYKVIMILEESILQKREEEKSNLEVIYPTDGAVMIPSAIMIVNNQWSANKNLAAAEAITDWFLSEAGQSAIVAGWMHSVRIDFPKTPYDSKPTGEIRAKSIPVNWENNYRQREQILNRFEERR